jgi:hypothetical protein
MKRIFSIALVAGIVVLGAKILLAQTPVDMEVKNFAAPVYCWSSLNVLSNNFYVGGVRTVPSNTLYSSSYNIPIANLTNALPSAGSYIGGNLSTNTLTNAIVKAMWKGLPTSTNGLVSGQIWLNSNVLTIVP